LGEEVHDQEVEQASLCEARAIYYFLANEVKQKLLARLAA
jgi:hypothetical protein